MNKKDATFHFLSSASKNLKYCSNMVYSFFFVYSHIVELLDVVVKFLPYSIAVCLRMWIVK